MEQLLSFMPLTDDERAVIANNDTNIVLPDDITTGRVDPATITMIYGWQPDLGRQVVTAAGTNLKWVQTMSAGVDYLPLTELTKNNVAVTNASGIHAAAIAQSILGYIFHFTRGIWTAEQRRSAHHWEQSAPDLLVADETSVLIFSTGHIATETARLLKEMGVHVAGINHTGHPADHFDETFPITDYAAALKTADVIVNIMPGTPETEGYFNKAFFDQLTDKLLFINVGRGSSVVNDDLIAAIDNGNVKYAALDVVAPEPLPTTSPLWDHERILLTPHISGVMDHLGTRLFPIFSTNLASLVADGHVSRNEVDLNAGY
ncbi:NAD(P)-dependent oxidoreductase [Furfurilactobacillus entadae]|uniref:NAD(P)-dependent oxidoreductase n=1 Tax=Furfurilactobacillus entadae TaxID=2922307 RepID=UPI0035EBE7A5